MGLRVASAYSCKDLVSYCRRKGWGYSVSVTDPRKKAPILRRAVAMGLRDDETRGSLWTRRARSGRSRGCTGRPGGRRSRCAG